MRGRIVPPAAIRQAVEQLEFTRTVDQRGYVRIQRFYLYAERGLARQRVSIWLYQGRLEIAYFQALLARYHYRTKRQHMRLQSVEQPRLYPTAYMSPQLALWELDDAQWHKVGKRPARYQRTKQAAVSWVEQLPLDAMLALVLVISVSTPCG